MGTPYTEVEIQNYNLNPPADDGSQTPANEITWAKHKTKLTDPLRDAIEDVDDATAAAFVKVAGGVTSLSDDYTVLAGDQGLLLVQTVAAKTFTTPDATTVGEPFRFWALNASSGVLTLDGHAAQTVDGAANISIPAGCGCMVETDGSNWKTGGQNWLRIGSLTGLTADATPDETADYMVTYDASAAALKKVLLQDIPKASQADQETATNTTRAVTPGRQQFHPSAAKCWACVTGGGTPSLAANYNITSLADTGTGRLTLTIATDFSSANWAANPSIVYDFAGGQAAVAVQNTTIAAGSVEIDSGIQGTGRVDPNGWFFTGFGDQ